MSGAPVPVPPIATSTPGAQRSIRANATAIAAAQFAGKFLGFGVILILTRAYSVEDYGRFALAATVAAFLLPALDLGTDLHVTRVAANDPARAPGWLGSALLLKTTSLAVALPVALIVTRLMHLPSETAALIAWGILGAGALALMGSFTAVLRARERMDIEAQLVIASRALIFAAAALAAGRGAGIVTVGAAIAIGAMIAVGLALLLSTAHGVHSEFGGAIGRWRDLIVGGLPFALTAVMVSIYFRIATLLLAHQQGERSVGIYSANANLVAAAMLISQAIVTAVFPKVARARALDDPSLQPVLRRATTLSLALGLPLAVGAALLAGPLLTLLFGADYAGGAVALILIMFTVPVLFLTNLLGHCLAALGRQRVVLIVAAVNALLNLGLNLWLIPRFDYAGASIATLVTEFAGLLSFVLILWPYRAAFLERNGMIAVLAANAILGAGVIAVRSFGVIPAIAAGIVLYAALMFATRVVRLSDIPFHGRITLGTGSR